jgi:hypothetical protein
VALWDPDFYTGVRGWTVPLVYKLVPGDWPRVLVQLGLSIACWTVLAAVVAIGIRRPSLRPFAFVAVLLFSLSFEVVAWDSILLSESLSLSLGAALVAAWLTLVDRQGRAALVVVLCLTLLWVGTRDTNAYVVLFAVPLVAAWAALRRESRRPAIAAAVCTALAGLAGALSADAGERWLAPLDDSIRYHVLADAEITRWFVDRGMPAAASDPEFGPWVLEEGRSTYAEYLVSHPVRTLAEPFRDLGRLEELLAPDLRRYPEDVRVTLPQPVATLLYPSTALTLFFSLVVVASAAWMAGRRGGFLPVWSIPAALALVAMPHTILVWHGSGMEFGRHALVGAVALRLAALLLALFVLDALLAGKLRAPTSSR